MQLDEDCVSHLFEEWSVLSSVKQINVVALEDSSVFVIGWFAVMPSLDR